MIKMFWIDVKKQVQETVNFYMYANFWKNQELTTYQNKIRQEKPTTVEELNKIFEGTAWQPTCNICDNRTLEMVKIDNDCETQVCKNCLHKILDSKEATNG